MARYGVIADIHGNREALAAALAALDARGVSRVVCLGDIIGYNADPDECVAMVRSRCAVSIAGNHELIGLGRLDFSRCSTNARYALKRTRHLLSSQSANWLAALPPTCRLEDGVVLVHGGVRDVQQYMAAPQHIRENAEYLRADFPGARVCFFGHSHEQRVYEVDGPEVAQISPQEKSFFPREQAFLLDRAKTCFVNPGSVDASRKSRHKLAECALFDSEAWRVEFLRVPYDCAATEAKATVYGYRMGPWTERYYRLRRRIGLQ